MKYAKIFMLIIAALFAVNSAAYAESAAYQEHINLEFHASKYIGLDKKITRIFVGSSNIINVSQPSSSMNEFVITAKNTKGSTTLFIWTADGARYEYLVNVVDEEIGQAAIIEEAIGLPDVHVRKVGSRILLTGTVKNQYERNLALQTAMLYVGNSSNNLSVGSNVNMSLDTSSSTDSSSNDVEVNNLENSGTVIDLLHMISPLQIRLEAQVIEISSDKAKDLGIQYGASNSGGIFYFGESYDRTNKTRYYRDSDGTLISETYGDPVDFKDKPLRWLEQRFGPINATINALVSKGDARILSRPNITTMSGEQATIQIGGQIPYQSVTGNGTPHTEFKNYGIILQFKPIIDAENRITSLVHTEVSNLSGQTVDGQPILATRRADSVVNINSGSTMIIGGLMDSSEAKNVSKIPLLGDIPILGEFFKYTTKSRNKRELIIVITPYIMGDGETSRAAVTNDMRDYYHAGQREKNSLNDVDLNALPPPFEEENKNTKKDKPKKHYKKSKDEKEKSADDEKQSDDTKEKSEDDEKQSENKKKKSKDKKEKHSGTSFEFGIFGDAF